MRVDSLFDSNIPVAKAVMSGIESIDISNTGSLHDIHKSVTVDHNLGLVPIPLVRITGTEPGGTSGTFKIREGFIERVPNYFGQGSRRDMITHVDENQLTMIFTAENTDAEEDLTLNWYWTLLVP